MKIYKFQYKGKGGDTEWVCAPNIKEARKFYTSESGVDSFEDFIVKALTKEELKNSYLLDADESEPDWEEYEGDLTEDDFSCGYLIIETMEEYLKTAKYTGMVATTNF